MSDNFICIAEFLAKPKMIEKLIKELGKLLPPTKLELGCISYKMYESLENPNELVMIEKFKDREAFEFHLKTDYVRNFVDNVMPMLVEKVKLGTYGEISA